GEQRLDLRAEQERLGGRSVVERLLAEPVTREDQASRSPIPDGQREHPAEPGKNLRAPGMPAIDDDLGVAAAAERVAERIELPPDLRKVIDFAIVADPDRPVSARHRLMAGRRGVDDRQAGMPE